jgi:hypothetical protein
LRDLGIDGGIILKWILGKYSFEIMDSIVSRYIPAVGLHEQAKGS